MAIRISLGQIKDGLNEFELKVSPGEIGLEDDLLLGELEIRINVEKVSNQLDLDVKLNGTMNLKCDRCLELFEKKFSNSFELVYVVNAFDDKIENDDYVRPYSAHMRYLDITKDVKDFTELSIPMRRAPEEKPDGSCSWCGKTAEYWNSFIVDKDKEEQL